MRVRHRPQRSMGQRFGKLLAAGFVLALILAASAWVARQLLVTRVASHMQGDDQLQETSIFEYTVSADVDHIRVNGTANFPNGVILVGTLDRVGSGPVEVKEALVMNRRFAMEFGPELYMQYYLHSPQNALQASMYRIGIEFDPSQQSPFVQESLLRLPFMKGSPTHGNSSHEVDAAIIRLSKMFAIGSTEEQQETQAREQQYRETIRQHLHDTLGRLTSFWQHLQVQYQQEQLKGSFSRADRRADEWQTWSAQWLHDLQNLGGKARLYEVVSPASPYDIARDALLTVHKQLALMPNFYFEVLINERPLSDPDLQRAVHLTQYALGDAIAQLGQSEKIPSPVKVDSVPPTVIVTAPVINVRNGPGMHYESIKQLKKEETLDLLSERGEWFQVRLDGGRTGWVHRNVASKRSQGDAPTDDIRRLDVKPSSVERSTQLRLEPIRLSSTPVKFIPPPTSDEAKIYVEIESQLRDLQAHYTGTTGERRAVEQRILQRMSEKYGISPEQIWNTYLKVQGWEIKP